MFENIKMCMPVKQGQSFLKQSCDDDHFLISHQAITQHTKASVTSKNKKMLAPRSGVSTPYLAR